MTAPFGKPSELQVRSLTSTLVVEPTLGFDVSHSAVNVEEGRTPTPYFPKIEGSATPNCENFIMRDGRLEPRSVLSRLGDAVSAASHVVGTLVGGIPANSVAGARYVLLGARSVDSFAPSLVTVSKTYWSYLAPGVTAWSQVELGPRGDGPGGLGLSSAIQTQTGDYWDFTQIYSDIDNENIVVGGLTSRGTILQKWIIGSTGSTVPMVSSPGARFVCAFNDYLIAANTAEDGVALPQRVRWSDRGSASSWTGGVSGFQDLLGTRGGITRILPSERGVVVFFEDEIWIGTPVDFPYTFNFSQLDTTIGCPYSWTATVTPRGIMFMARNYQLYLLPKEGGPAQPIGAEINRRIRDTIVQPTQAFSTYDGVNDLYHFYYSSGASANFANRAMFMHFSKGQWAPQSFDTNKLVLTRAFTAPISTSHISTWDDFTNFQPTVTWNQIAESWDNLLGIGNERQTVLALSATTVFQYSSTMTQDSQESSGGSTAGLPRTAFWEGKPQGAFEPTAQKVITRVDVEYVAPSASSLTVRTSADQGATYGAGIGLSLMTASNVTQMPAYVYQPARYPMFRVESSAQTGIELHRFHVTVRTGGR